MTDGANAGRLSTASARFRWIWIAPVFAMLALGAWAFASPIGASPDDDFHLSSILCANGARADLCIPDPGQSADRLVLPGIAKVSCYVADENASAGCQDWSGDPLPNLESSHGNWSGAYPPVYYAVMSAFASTDIQVSALVMRLFNVVLFLALATALAFLLPSELKVPLIAGWMITGVPLGAYLIASNNPGSWAMIGVGASWLAALGWFRSSGRRFWALGVLTVFAVALAAGARADAALYSIVGLGIAAFLSFSWTRQYWLKLLLPVALVAMASVFFFSSGNSAVAVEGLAGSGPDGSIRDPGAILAFNLISIPRLWTGVFGSWGLGWLMEIWPGYAMVEFAALVVFIGLASLGIRKMYPRKSILVVALVGVLYLLPLYVLTIGLNVVGENVQPRYLLPLVIVLGGLLLLTGNSSVLRPGRWHVIPAVVLLIGANSVALYINLRRYVTGFDVEQLSLDAGAEWWWPSFPLGPTALWLLGSAAFAATVVILGAAWLREGSRPRVAA